MNDAELDNYGGWTGIQGERTGFFHQEKIDGRNWFVTPQGNVFFPVALSHLLSAESDAACENIYKGDQEAWVRASLATARAMGFNCALGGATSPERNLTGFVDIAEAEAIFREENFPFVVGVILLKHPREFIEGETLPDIFDPAFEQVIESKAEAICPAVADDPLVMGYYYGFGAFNQSEHWVNHHLSLPADSPGRNAIIDLLAQRYDGDVRQFNRIYGTSLGRIADLKQTAVLTYDKAFERRNYRAIRKTLNPRQLNDFEAILSHMCVTLYKIAHTAIRRWDRTHLIFGSFIKEWALTGESWKVAAPYIDMIAPQHFNREISVNELADAADLPILMSDDYFGFHYPGEKGKRHAGVTSHDARGEIYRASLMRHYKDPQVLGVTYCACMYDQAGDSLERNLQNGYYDMQGNPRDKLIAAVTDINRAVYTHTPHPGTAEELRALEQTLFNTWDKYNRGDW